jgi:protein JBTS26
VLEINITDTWGDLFYVGLSGIEVLDTSGKVIPITFSNVTANPRDMNAI